MTYRYYLNEDYFDFDPNNYPIMCEYHYSEKENPRIYLLDNDTAVALIQHKDSYFGPGVVKFLKQLRRIRNLETLED